MKAYVFYHTFIENVAAKLPHMYSKPEEARVAYRKAEQHFLSRMKVRVTCIFVVPISLIYD